MTELKLYPELPTAPEEETSSLFTKYNRVKNIYNEMKVMKEERHKCYKKYSKATSVLQNIIISLTSLSVIESGVGIATSLTIVGLPVGIVLTSLGIASGGCAAILTPISKHTQKKKLKHMRKEAILDTGLILLDKKIFKALNDRTISDEEFSAIVTEYEKIRNSLSTNNIGKIKAELRADLKKELINNIN